jgi:hypothetical protein
MSWPSADWSWATLSHGNWFGHSSPRDSAEPKGIVAVWPKLPVLRETMIKKVSPVTCLFFDVGVVLLTNGWDHIARRRAVEHFHLDWDEMEEFFRIAGWRLRIRPASDLQFMSPVSRRKASQA